MGRYEYYSQGKLQRLSLTRDWALNEHIRGVGARNRDRSAETVTASRLERYFIDTGTGIARLPPAKTGPTLVVVTDTLIIDEAQHGAIRKLCAEYQLSQFDEGPHGLVLLKADVDAGDDATAVIFAAAKAAYEGGRVGAAQPNFGRFVAEVDASASGAPRLWHQHNDGDTGVPGADIAARAAWTIGRGQPATRVAVLDDGVDTSHPALQAAVVAAKDFVDDNNDARPDLSDAHGTKCAGIISSRDAKFPGIAPECSLVAVRIAQGDGSGKRWIFDDWTTAKAIDWAWDKGQADVISCSWGSKLPSDPIARAIERARAQGRNGRGTVVVCAAGNDDGPVVFPATADGVIAVGASNQWDQRKSRTSDDGEHWWGSNYGKRLDLLAPGVQIVTTGLQGGYSLTFNGTSEVYAPAYHFVHRSARYPCYRVKGWGQKSAPATRCSTPTSGSRRTRWAAS